jgi:hypothetical protein
VFLGSSFTATYKEAMANFSMKELPPIVQTHPAYSKDQRHRLAPSNDNV